MYICPMHPEVRQDGPGTCPKCGMHLVLENAVTKTAPSGTSFFASYKPLFVIVGLIVLVALVSSFDVRIGTVNRMDFMSGFMAGFFLVFSGFKLLNVAGFAEGYAKYDLLAMRWEGYGYLYPFMELALGLLYLHIPADPYLNAFTLFLMLFSGIGVAIKIAKKETFQCACLGTFIDVPLTSVTLVEDFGMALMASVMLLS